MSFINGVTGPNLYKLATQAVDWDKVEEERKITKKMKIDLSGMSAIQQMRIIAKIQELEEQEKQEKMRKKEERKKKWETRLKSFKDVFSKKQTEE